MSAAGNYLLEEYWTPVVEIRAVSSDGESTENDWITGVTNSEAHPYVTINFKEGDPIQLLKYVSEPTVTFTNLTGENSFTVPQGAASAAVEFTVKGSFTAVPAIKAVCEGNWTSGNVTVIPSSEGYSCSVDVAPTTAYANDQNNGKLTIYVPYYGSTAIAQLDLISNGVGYIELQSKEYEGNQTEVSITFLTDEGLNVVGGQYQPLRISANYDTSGDNWLSVGKVTRVEKEGKVPIKQIVDMEPYITTSTVAQARKCTLAVFSPSGKEVTRFIVKQNPVIVDPTGYTDLAENGSANCYIIKNQGKFRMPLRKGNSAEFINGGNFDNISIVKLFTDNESNLVKVEGLPIEKPEVCGYF